MLDTSLKKARKTFYSVEEKENFRLTNVLVLPFYCDLLKITRLLKSFNVQVVFSYSSTVRSLLIKNSPLKKCGCIYEIPCRDCDKKYIGQTSKALETRVKQHKYCVRVGNMSNALFVHMNNNNHGIDWNNAREIIFCSDFLIRNVIESSIIKSNFENLLNISPGMYKLDDYIIKMIVENCT